MPLIHNLILSIQALIARQLRSHFTDKEVEAPGKEAIYQTEHLLTVAEPGKKWAAGTRHPEVLSRPALQGVSQLPGCLTGLPWSLASFSSAGEPGTQTLSCNPPGPPSRRGALKTWGPSPQDCDPKVPHPLLPEARGFFFFFLSMTRGPLEKHLQQGNLIPGRASAGQARREGTAFGVRPALLLASCVTSGKSLDRSEPRVLLWKGSDFLRLRFP